jgi:fructose-specific component phosphotransferase system IIB-like protein
LPGHRALDEIRRTHEPFSTRHRIIDVQGRTREVVVVAGHLRNDAGEVIGTDGFYVDVTRSIEEHQTTITEAVAEIAEHRSTIEQAKGVLMMVYDIDADAAFDVLKWRSQESNIKLRLLAERLMSQFQSLRSICSPLFRVAPPRRDVSDLRRRGTQISGSAPSRGITTTAIGAFRWLNHLWTTPT